MDRSFQGVVLSLVLHSLLMWILIRGEFAPMDLSQNDTTEIVIVERDKPEKSKTFVTDPDDRPQEDLVDKLKDQADFLSAFTERVKRQVVARNNTGPTRNAQAPTRPKGDPEGIAGSEERGKDDEGFLAPGGGREPTRHVAIGQSSIAEYIPGVEEGSFTALNTDQFTYYAFFARMNEQVRNRWISLIRDYMSRVTRDQLAAISAANRMTRVEIILKPNGEFYDSVVHTSSGDEQLDQATVRAFRRAAPFPNPPAEMVEDDNLIHLYYSFTIRFRPPGFGPAGG